MFMVSRVALEINFRQKICVRGYNAFLFCTEKHETLALKWKESSSQEAFFLIFFIEQLALCRLQCFWLYQCPFWCTRCR